MDLYSEIILDHYQNPHHTGELPDPKISIFKNNPLCGDTIELDLKISGGKIKDVAFIGNGCAISQASMSLLSDYIIGKKTEEVLNIKSSEIYELLGVPISPARVKCALLGLDAAQELIKSQK